MKLVVFTDSITYAEIGNAVVIDAPDDLDGIDLEEWLKDNIEEGTTVTTPPDWALVMAYSTDRLSIEVRDHGPSHEPARYSIWWTDGPRQEEDFFAQESDALDSVMITLLIEVQEHQHKERS